MPRCRWDWCRPKAEKLLWGFKKPFFFKSQRTDNLSNPQTQLAWFAAHLFYGSEILIRRRLLLHSTDALLFVCCQVDLQSVFKYIHSHCRCTDTGNGCDWHVACTCWHSVQEKMERKNVIKNIWNSKCIFLQLASTFVLVFDNTQWLVVLLHTLFFSHVTFIKPGIFSDYQNLNIESVQ